MGTKVNYKYIKEEKGDTKIGKGKHKRANILLTLVN